MPTTDDVTAQLSDLFFRIGRRVRSRANDRLAPSGLTASQFRALRHISHHEPLRIVELARKLDIGARSAGDIVDALVTGGLAVREPDPADRRSILVSLSDEGRARFDDLRQSRREGAGEIFGTLPVERQGQLLELLRELDEASAPPCAKDKK